MSVVQVKSSKARQLCLKVIEATYKKEKNWVKEPDELFPGSDLQNDNMAWFMAQHKQEPVGILRVAYDPPLHLYAQYGLNMIREDINIDRFISENKIAEIGRFAVLPKYRSAIAIVALLMREATVHTIRKGFTHYITDVFEGEVHSPYNFHTRVIGFEPIATHDHGEINCPNRRITMLLDIKKAYERLRTKGKRIYNMITQGWDEKLHLRLKKS